MRIAMIGQRGLPATFGGVEHHVEELGARLAARGHEVTVYCRTNYAEAGLADYRGMRLRHLPTISTKHLDAITHSTLSTLAAAAARFDVVHYHALGPGLPSPLARLSRARVVQTVHGLDQNRAKWGGTSQRVLQGAEWVSAHVPHALITVSEDLREHYRRRYGIAPVAIPNGAPAPVRRPADRIVAELGLRPGGYLLFLGRLVPEKAPDLLVRAFSRLPGDLRLVVAGGSSFTDGYVARLRELAAADPRVVFPGFVYGDLRDELYANAAAFVLPSALEGLPLTLLEAVAYRTPVVASDIPPHREVLGAGAPGQRLFRSGDLDGLAAALAAVGADPAAERAAAEALAGPVLARYDWDDVAARTEAVYRSLEPRRAPGRPARPATGGQAVTRPGQTVTRSAPAPAAVRSRTGHFSRDPGTDDLC